MRAAAFAVAATLAAADDNRRPVSGPATGPISWKQTQCLLDGQKIAFVGDSNMRFHFFHFNYFLETGEYRPYGGKGSYGAWGFDGPPDYDEGWKDAAWTESVYRGNNPKHRMELERTFPGVGGARSHFWFVRATWFGEMENQNGGKPDAKDMDDLAAALRDYDIVVFNSGWWDIKDYRGGSGSAFEYSRGYGNCGNEWTDLCRKSYARDVELAIDKLLAPAEVAIFRSSSCCGDYAGRPDGRSVAAMNEIAERKAKNAGVEYVEVFDLYGPDDLAEATVDGTHARPEPYHDWTMRVLAAVEETLDTGCLKATEPPTPRPNPRPTTSPYPTFFGPPPPGCPRLRPVAECPADGGVRFFECDNPLLERNDLCKSNNGECRTSKDLDNCVYKGKAGADIYAVVSAASQPSSRPTRADCRDDPSWFKKDEPAKTCDRRRPRSLRPGGDVFLPAGVAVVQKRHGISTSRPHAIRLWKIRAAPRPVFGRSSRREYAYA